MSMDFYQIEQGFAYGEPNAIPLARITMRTLSNGAIAIDHTYVSPSLRGQGIARKLVLLVVEVARKEGRLIAPLCSYARVVLQGDENLKDLIAP